MTKRMAAAAATRTTTDKGTDSETSAVGRAESRAGAGSSTTAASERATGSSHGNGGRQGEDTRGGQKNRPIDSEEVSSEILSDEISTSSSNSGGSGSDSSHNNDVAENENEKGGNGGRGGYLDSAMPWMSAVIWPLMITVPWILSSPYSFTSYERIFPKRWYEYDPVEDEPKPLGLCLGIFAVAVGQMWTIAVFFLYKFGYFSSPSKNAAAAAEPTPIQTRGARSYEFAEGVRTHLMKPGGFAVLATYLTVTWMMHWMPASYYGFRGAVQYDRVAYCLFVQELASYAVHRAEHVVSPWFYRHSHKPHHKFTNPRMFDAYNGSVTDTMFMMVLPLFLTANVVRDCNVWTYMTFGSVYSCWLTLIHSEYAFPWDVPLFRSLGLGTPADHHVHHKLFRYNYGHLLMWFDVIFGTYRNPSHDAPKVFHKNV